MRGRIPRAIAALPHRLLGRIGLLGIALGPVALGGIAGLLPVSLLPIALGIALSLAGHLTLPARVAGGLAGVLVAHARLISILWTAVIHPYTFTFPPPGRRHILFHGAACAEKKRRQLEWRWPFVHQYTTVYTLVNSHFVKKGAEKCRAVLWADERT